MLLSMNLMATTKMVWATVEMLKKKKEDRIMLMDDITKRPAFLGVFSPITTKY